jgi:hypothetical protein
MKNVTAPGTIGGFKPLVRRFAAPVIAAWLLHMGIWWFIVFVAEPSVMSALTKMANWLILHFTARAWPIEELSWPSLLTAYQMPEVILPVIVGLIIGWWVLRRNVKIPKESL